VSSTRVVRDLERGFGGPPDGPTQPVPPTGIWDCPPRGQLHRSGILNEQILQTSNYRIHDQYAAVCPL